MYAFDAFCIWMRAWCSLDYCERSDILLYALLSVESGRARRQCVGIGVISTQLDTLDLAFSGKAVVGGVLLGKRSSATDRSDIPKCH
jgi:hypothetical protein